MDIKRVVITVFHITIFQNCYNCISYSKKLRKKLKGEGILKNPNKTSGDENINV